MESFAALKRRTTDLLQSLPQSLPQLPQLPTIKPKGHNHAVKGTWERISLPPLPRSSHSLDIVDGKAYVFGGEAGPRKPVDGSVHVVVLPYSGAPADYYAIKPVPARRSAPIAEDDPDEEERGITVEDAEAAEEARAKGKGKEKDLEEISLTSPDGADESATAAILEDEPPVVDKGKGKAPVIHVPAPGVDALPVPRVGHATATIGSRILLFGGRGGSASTPLEEKGRVWVFDTKTHTWSYLDPAPPVQPDPLSPATLDDPAAATAVHYPAARSDHCAVSTTKPSDFGDVGLGRRPRRAESWQEWAEGDSRDVGTPQAPIVGNIAARSRDADDDGFGTLVVHGGRLADGSRAADVWAFDVRSRVWKQLPPAPGPPRAGAALCISKSRLYRFGGSAGAGDEAGQLDVLQLGVDTFDDNSSFGEVSLAARGGWHTLTADPAATAYRPQQQGPQDLEAAAAPGEAPAAWPGARSAAGLQAVTTGGGREYLVLLLGERAAGGDGGPAAFWDDVWAFQVPPQGLSAASVHDAISGALGWKTGEGRWTRVETAAFDDDDDDAADGPGPRGYAATATMGELEENGVVVWGGLAGPNQRLGDGWILRLG